jgi:hypothetical protein
MRFILPVVAAATMLSIGLTPAAAQSRSHHRQQPQPRTHVSLHLSTHTVLAGNGIALSGKVRPSGRRRVRIAFRGPDSGHVGVVTRANGSFALRWRPRRTGSYALRARVLHAGHRRAARSDARDLTTYRLAGASYYGPGLYGNGVACGGTLMPGTMGVANKTLPCGTMVKLRYHGRSVTVRVIDRGPYVAGRDYDLTEAVKQKLGFPGVGTVLATR